MATYVYKCAVCEETKVVEEGVLRGHAIPQHCSSSMKRDYKAESVGVTFQGGGWARKSK